jgi:hypothetical protein
VLSGNSDSPTWTSPPCEGLSFAPFTPPSVLSISGCPNVSAGGLTVMGCLPHLHVLTVTGSADFLMWLSTSVELAIGSTSTPLYMSLSTADRSSHAPVWNDTTLFLYLDTTYVQFLAAHDFGGPVLPLIIRQWLTGEGTSALYVQFAPLPPPSFTSITPYTAISWNAACQWNANRTALLECVAGGSGLQIRGHYMYDLAVTVAGQPMTLSAQDVTMIALTTALYNYQPGVAYDLVLTAASGMLVVPGFLTFNAAPAIVTAACRDPDVPYVGEDINCAPRDTLVVNGPNLPPSSTPLNITIFSSRSELNSCINPRYRSPTQVACDFTEPGLPSTTGWDAIYLQWATGLSMAVTERFDLWGYPNAPRIKAITASGCGDPVNSPNLTLAGCHGGELVTVTGYNFLAYPAFSMAMTPYSLNYFQLTNRWSFAIQCAEFAVIDDTTAVCALPVVEQSPLLDYGVTLMMAMVNYTTATSWRSQSNFVFLAFTPSTASASPSPSSSTATTVAVSVVFGALAVFATVSALVWRVRRRRKAAQGSPRGDGGLSGGDSSLWSRMAESKEVELSSQ